MYISAPLRVLPFVSFYIMGNSPRRTARAYEYAVAHVDRHRLIYIYVVRPPRPPLLHPQKAGSGLQFLYRKHLHVQRERQQVRLIRGNYTYKLNITYDRVRHIELVSLAMFSYCWQCRVRGACHCIQEVVVEEGIPVRV